VDGRWLAYVSDESGRDEVYVRPFPNTDDGFWMVSTGGGGEPVWAHSSRELFYRSDGNLMVQDVLQGEAFAIGERRVLFSAEPYRAGPRHPHYDVTPDGRHFLMIRPLSGSGGETELIVVENVFEELKARAGN
jgi:serine/threonine-protein kinase